MAEVRVTQLGVEYLYDGTNQVRVTQLGVEYLYNGTDQVRVTQLGVEYLYFNQAGPVPSVPSPPATPTDTAVDEVTVEFDVDIQSSTFTIDDVTLTKDGGPNTMGPPATIEVITKKKHKIKNLSSLTVQTGTYTLTVIAAGIDRETGEPGSPGDDVVVTWDMEEGAGDPAASAEGTMGMFSPSTLSMYNYGIKCVLDSTYFTTTDSFTLAGARVAAKRYNGMLAPSIVRISSTTRSTNTLFYKGRPIRPSLKDSRRYLPISLSTASSAPVSTLSWCGRQMAKGSIGELVCVEKTISSENEIEEYKIVNLGSLQITLVYVDSEWHIAVAIV